MEKNVNFKDAASQAVDIVFNEFKELLGLRIELSLRWIDKECGLADINNGLLVISYADMLVAIRQQISYKEIQEWSDYNTRLTALGYTQGVVELKDWNKPGIKIISDFDITLMEEVQEKYNNAKAEYEKMAEEFEKKIWSTQNTHL